jgi:hypothetical protein
MFPPTPLQHIKNCKTVEKRSLFSVRFFAAKPSAGGLWAYGFAVIHFCKKFSIRGVQAGADERGFRDVSLSVAPFRHLRASFNYEGRNALDYALEAADSPIEIS